MVLPTDSSASHNAVPSRAACCAARRRSSSSQRQTPAGLCVAAAQAWQGTGVARHHGARLVPQRVQRHARRSARWVAPAGWTAPLTSRRLAVPLPEVGSNEIAAGRSSLAWPRRRVASAARGGAVRIGLDAAWIFPAGTAVGTDQDLPHSLTSLTASAHPRLVPALVPAVLVAGHPGEGRSVDLGRDPGSVDQGAGARVFTSEQRDGSPPRDIRTRVVWLATTSGPRSAKPENWGPARQLQANHRGPHQGAKPEECPPVRRPAVWDLPACWLNDAPSYRLAAAACHGRR